MAVGIGYTSNFSNAVTLRGIHDVIYHQWDARDGVGREVFEVFESTQNREDSLTVGGIGTFGTKTEGESVNYSTPVEGFRQTFTHVEYAQGIRATDIMVQDELYPIIEERAIELGRAAVETEETVLANHLNNANDSAFTGPDGIELLSAVHVREDGTTYANELGTAADLAKTSLEQAFIDFRAFTDGAGKKLRIKPARLIVPPELEFVAERLLKSEFNPTVDYSAASDSESAVNPLASRGLDLKVWDFLTDANGWFLQAGPGQHKLVLYERAPFFVSSMEDFDTGDLKSKATFRQASGWRDPRGFFGTAGA